MSENSALSNVEAPDFDKISHEGLRMLKRDQLEKLVKDLVETNS